MARPQPKLPPHLAKRKILSILQRGIIEKSWHCENESMPLRQIDDNDIRHALLHGQIFEDAVFDKGRWKYRVEGTDVEGVEVTVMTVIQDRNSLYIITVF